MNKTLVIIPTYNEKETLPLAIDSVFKHEGIDVLVIDDNSPDGTAGVVKDKITKGSRLFLIERTGKLGLGTAYIEGFKWGLKQGYEYFIEMDADGSHDPEAVPFFIREMEKGYGLVIGSRYLNETISVVGWDFSRLMLSKFGNFYASTILHLDLTDLTSGFRCYTRSALEGVNLALIRSSGYGFQIEMAHSVACAGFEIGEMPIIFYERASGVSKMSKAIIGEAVLLPWQLRAKEIFDSDRKGFLENFRYHFRTILAFLSLTVGLAGGVRLGYWLSYERDIIEIIHEFKMGLPAWVWMAMKVGLSAVSGLLLMIMFAVLAMGLSGTGRRK